MLAIFSTTLTQHKKDLEKNKKTKTKNANQIDKLTLRIAFIDSRIQKDEAKFTILSQKRGATQSQHTKTMDHQLDVLTNRMQKDKENIKMLGIQLAEAQKIQKAQPDQITQNTKAIAYAKKDLLQSSRLVADFVRLLQDFSPNFEDHKAKFLSRLEKLSYSMGKEILKMIHDNPDLFSVRNPKILDWNFQNTNTIEGIFAKFRRLLNATRLLSSDAGCERYCELFRLYHNTTPPFTGPHQNESPVERLGVKLKGNTYLDLIFPTRGRITHFFMGDQNIHRRKSTHFYAAKKDAMQNSLCVKGNGSILIILRKLNNNHQ